MKKIFVFLLVFSLISAVFCVSGCKKDEEQLATCAILDVKLQNQVLSGSVLYNCNNGSEYSLFHLYPNGIFLNAPILTLTVTQVFIDDQKSNFELVEEGCYLKVQNPKNQKNFKIIIYFETLLKEDNGRLGIANGIFNCAFFYPIPCVLQNGEYQITRYTKWGDPIYQPFLDMEVSLTLPSVYVVACGFNSSGVQLFEEETTYYYSEKKVKSFAFSASESFSVTSKKWGNKRVNCYFIDELDGENTVDFIISALNFYTQRVGESPRENFSVAVSDYSSGGMEYSAFCVVKNSKDKSNFLYALAHELAHQWFAHGVGNNEFAHGYFDEGLCEYLTAKFLSEYYGKNYYGLYIGYAASALSGYKAACTRLNIEFNGKLARDLSSFKNSEEYVVIAYRKSLLLFNEIEKEVGEKKIFEALSKFYSKYKYKNASMEQFINCFSTKRAKIKKIVNSF